MYQFLTNEKKTLNSMSKTVICQEHFNAKMLFKIDKMIFLWTSIYYLPIQIVHYSKKFVFSVRKVILRKYYESKPKLINEFKLLTTPYLHRYYFIFHLKMYVLYMYDKELRGKNNVLNFYGYERTWRNINSAYVFLSFFLKRNCFKS